MDSTTKQVMVNALNSESVRKMFSLIKEIQPQEAPGNFAQWLEQILDTADVTTDINDFTDENHVVNYEGYYRAVYNEVKQFIINKVNYALNDWKVTDQPIEQ